MECCSSSTSPGVSWYVAFCFCTYLFFVCRLLFLYYQHVIVVTGFHLSK